MVLIPSPPWTLKIKIILWETGLISHDLCLHALKNTDYSWTSPEYVWPKLLTPCIIVLIIIIIMGGVWWGFGPQLIILFYYAAQLLCRSYIFSTIMSGSSYSYLRRGDTMTTLHIEHWLAGLYPIGSVAKFHESMSWTSFFDVYHLAMLLCSWWKYIEDRSSGNILQCFHVNYCESPFLKPYHHISVIIIIIIQHNAFPWSIE